MRINEIYDWIQIYNDIRTTNTFLEYVYQVTFSYECDNSLEDVFTVLSEIKIEHVSAYNRYYSKICIIENMFNRDWIGITEW